ncbi:MAG: T9SS type A sorting domain-containing protein [Crocinitomicaceae bacterium]
MKNFTLSLFVLVLNFAVAQNVPIDFESVGNGANWTWTTFENDANPTLQIIANPDPTGANTSATVAQFTALQAGQPWAGCESMHGADLGSFTFDATNSTVKIMVWKTVISDVGIKFVEPASGSLGELKIANTVTNQWEELVFDFSGHIGNIGTIDQIVIFPDFDLAGRTQDNITYFDNITVGTPIPEPEPMTAAPTPALPASDVLSMFSDPYTDVPVDTWNTGWSAATFSDIVIAGNPTKKYTDLNFNGIETTSTPLDLTTAGMQYFHMDLWTPNSTEIRIKLVDFGGDGYQGANADTEFEYLLTPGQEQWVTVEIPLSDFTGMNQNDINQLIISSSPAGSSTIYIDNVFFAKTSIQHLGLADDNTSIELTAFPNPTNNSWQITAVQNIETIQLFDITGKTVYRNFSVNLNTVLIDANKLPKGTYSVLIQTESGNVSKLLIKQ